MTRDDDNKPYYIRDGQATLPPVASRTVEPNLKIDKFGITPDTVIFRLDADSRPGSGRLGRHRAF